MEKTHILILTFITIATGLAQAQEKSGENLPPFISNERKLYHKLIDPLEKSVRPVKKHDDAIQLQLGLTLLHFDALDERSQVLRTNIWLRMSWVDPQLTWDPKEYDGLTQIRIPSSQIWSPDIVIYNMAHNLDEMMPTYDWLQVVVDYNGTVIFIPHYKVETTCNLDLSQFPYDTQTCVLKFGSWVYHTNQVNLTHYGGAYVDTSSYVEHQVWDLTNHTVKLNRVKYDCCPETYADMTYTFTIKRRSDYYTKLFVAPSVILCFITPTLFWLPPDGSEKMALGSGVLLGQILMLIMLESSIPAPHPIIPKVGMYYLFGLVMVALALILSVMVRNVWSQGNRKKSLPRVVQTVVLGLMGRLLCVRREPYMAVQELQEMDGDIDDRTAANKVASVNARSEWRQLAVILDRLLFLLFLILTIIVSIAMLRS